MKLCEHPDKALSFTLPSLYFMTTELESWAEV